FVTTCGRKVCGNGDPGGCRVSVRTFRNKVGTKAGRLPSPGLFEGITCLQPTQGHLCREGCHVYGYRFAERSGAAHADRWSGRKSSWIRDAWLRCSAECS